VCSCVLQCDFVNVLQCAAVLVVWIRECVPVCSKKKEEKKPHAFSFCAAKRQKIYLGLSQCVKI